MSLFSRLKDTTDCGESRRLGVVGCRLMGVVSELIYVVSLTLALRLMALTTMANGSAEDMMRYVSLCDGVCDSV